MPQSVVSIGARNSEEILRLMPHLHTALGHARPEPAPARGRARVVEAVGPSGKEGGPQLDAGPPERGAARAQADQMQAALSRLGNAQAERASIAVFSRTGAGSAGGWPYKLVTMSPAGMWSAREGVSDSGRSSEVRTEEVPRISGKPTLLLIRPPIGRQVMMIDRVGSLNLRLAVLPPPAIEQISFEPVIGGDEGEMEFGFGTDDRIRFKRADQLEAMVVHLANGKTVTLGPTGILPPDTSLDMRA